MPDKFYTLEEAQALVPWLQRTFDEIDPLMADARRLEDELGDIMGKVHSNGHGEMDKPLDRKQKAMRDLTAQIQQKIDSVIERGIIVRSVDDGLVDFQSVREGREVYLCWIKGEREIKFWHETNVGFAGRQPL
ncbi:MAG: DUF2203 family protein [SAR202 cluster bacterium]|nr:DUF2203 family protein [SAR202 cluster bacterium]